VHVWNTRTGEKKSSKQSHRQGVCSLSAACISSVATQASVAPPPLAQQRKTVIFSYVSPAKKLSTPRQLDELFRFRYEIFCKRLQFFAPSACADERESDAHDRDALHFAEYDEQGNMLGAARLIQRRPLPLEEHCILFDDGPQISNLHVAEVSRLAVRSPQVGQVTSHLVERQTRQEIVVALYKAMILESRELGITHWVAAMERPLHRVLKGLGCMFTPIGPEVDYSGPVTPYIAEVERLWHEQRMTYLY
jgi:N-acyl amino acid synthase of PEP-CTERM/exosortase system